MWIGEFSERAGLNVATVRFYVRSGLLHPRQGSVGGARPYMEFSEKDLRNLGAIRAGQAMGMSLSEIKLLVSERRAGGRDRMLQAMLAQQEKLNERAEELSAMQKFVDAKISWLRGGAIGAPPELSNFRHHAGFQVSCSRRLFMVGRRRSWLRT
ncbi:MerR family transcriptional regulator [Rhizobacter sp. OV335]|uniref:helix-turn-helix domain-containing protein n=1 Tax=Rhizobacter sp. OV335 TaxID=1500264 RepID=UPI0009360935|nr:MerR family transcriptional regulator [Rhizobacter sp. OV335]